jgi:hypothetical protein
MNPTMTNPNAWEEVTPDLKIGLNERSTKNYLAAVKQFEVETNPRYARGHAKPGIGKETYCNIFLWDVTVAMNCEVAHWIDPATGVEVPKGKGIELSANGVCDWFSTHSLTFGWMKCGKTKAMERASVGFPAVVLWKNPGGIGHVAIVLPGTDFCHIAQAGTVNFFDQPLDKGFGSARPLVFYTHD